MLAKYKEYLEARNLSLNYYNIMKQLLAYLQEKGIEFSAVTQQDITDLFTTHAEYSVSTRNQWIKSARNFALFLGISDSEFTKIKLMKTDRKIPDYLTEDDLSKAIKYMATYHSDTYSSDKISAILLFLFYTGVRKGELIFLKRADINLEENVAKIWGQKSKQERFVYFPAKVKNILVKYFNSEKEEDNAFNLTVRKIDYICIILRKHIPNKKIKAHLFRHSACRNMLRHNIPLTVCKDIMGHANVSTTMLYASEDEPERRNIYKQRMK